MLTTAVESKKKLDLVQIISYTECAKIVDRQRNMGLKQTGTGPL